jgi:hypothetical protein
MHMKTRPEIREELGWPAGGREALRLATQPQAGPGLATAAAKRQGRAENPVCLRRGHGRSRDHWPAQVRPD